MIQPNAACAAFCSWMLNVSAQHLSTTQRALVQLVFNAATFATPVTDQQWYNFNLFTAWRNPYYIVYRDYASPAASTLLTGLLASYSLDNSSIDSTGAYDGTDTSIVYNTANGKINEGAYFDGVSSFISVPAISLGTDFTIALWLKPSASTASYGTLLSNVTGTVGLYYNGTISKVSYYSGSDHFNASALPVGSFTLVSFTVSAGVGQFYINGAADGFPVSSLSGVSLELLGGGFPGQFYEGGADIITIWGRSLTPLEQQQYFNSGLGIQYPF